MAKGFLTIGDLPSDLLRLGASRNRTKLRDLLSNPFLPTEQRLELESQAKKVDEWEQGISQVRPLTPEPPVVKEEASVSGRIGTNHSIEVVESIGLSEEG